MGGTASHNRRKIALREIHISKRMLVENFAVADLETLTSAFNVLHPSYNPCSTVPDDVRIHAARFLAPIQRAWAGSPMGEEEMGAIYVPYDLTAELLGAYLEMLRQPQSIHRNLALSLRMDIAYALAGVMLGLKNQFHVSAPTIRPTITVQLPPPAELYDLRIVPVESLDRSSSGTVGTGRRAATLC
jgi:hypothetical protein